MGVPPGTPLYLSFNPISIYPSINLNIEAANLSKEKKFVGISLCNWNKLEETNGIPSRDPYTHHLFLFQRWNPHCCVIPTFFCTLFVSSFVRFFFNNCCVAPRFCFYHPLWDFYSNTVMPYLYISELYLYHPLWDFYSYTAVSYLHFSFYTGLTFCRLHIYVYERMFSGNFIKNKHEAGSHPGYKLEDINYTVFG